MEMEKSKVYVLPDSSGYITRIDGGYTESNITDPENWVLIDEGNGDRYNLCQGNYFTQPIRVFSSILLFGWTAGMIRPKTPPAWKIGLRLNVTISSSGMVAVVAPSLYHSVAKSMIGLLSLKYLSSIM